MKQPELGKKILELRQQRGLTQQELVEQCNINVRTIQRIEAGEVTPRSFTIKTILEALDYDFDQLQANESKVESEFKKLMLLSVDDTKEASFLTKQLNIACIAGGIYFLLGFFEFAADWARVFGGVATLFSNPVYIIIKILSLVSFVLFIRGFILSGKIFGNYLIKISAFIIIVISVIFYAYDIASLFYGDDFYVGMMIAHSITGGVVGIIFGVSVLRLQNSLGHLALITGILEIVTYSLFATILFAKLGFVLIVPMTILEIILLYKITTLIKEKQQSLV